MFRSLLHVWCAMQSGEILPDVPDSMQRQFCKSNIVFCHFCIGCRVRSMNGCGREKDTCFSTHTITCSRSIEEKRDLPWYIGYFNIVQERCAQ